MGGEMAGEIKLLWLSSLQKPNFLKEVGQNGCTWIKSQLIA